MALAVSNGRAVRDSAGLTSRSQPRVRGAGPMTRLRFAPARRRRAGRRVCRVGAPRHVHTPRVAKPRTYEEKRDPATTNEPFGDAARGEAGGTLVGAFVVHLHDATRRHYDLRVEANGVLASFAVPKGPCLDPTEKRLAIHTEDHPLEYLDFEDVIPEGNYGGGPMIVWDRGTVRYLEGPSERGLVVGKLDMVFSGRKLRGRWALVKLGRSAGRPMREEDAAAWLFFKKRDAYASETDDIEARDRSVLSGLRVGELETRGLTAGRLSTIARSIAGGADACASPFTPPVERSGLSELPGDAPNERAFEPDLDGLRARVERDGDRVILVEHGDPTMRDLSAFYPELVRAARALPAERFALDGTVVTFDAAGLPSLPRLAARAAEIVKGEAHRATLEAPVTLVAQDLVSLDGAWLGAAPYEARRALLCELAAGEGFVQVSTLLPGPWRAARDLARSLGLRRLLVRHRRATLPAAPGEETLRVSEGPTPEIARVDHGSPKAALREVRITNPQKVYFPELGATKGRVIAYYRSVAGALLPHVRGRPVTVVRYPDGVHGKHFFQWNVPPQMPAWMRTVAFKDEEEPERPKRGFLLDDLESLLYVANLGVLPIHVFSCRAASLAMCDYVALDFDVKLASLPAAVALALELRAILDAIGLAGYPKTSGQTGLHVLAPLGAGHGYDTARALVEILGRLLVHRRPDLATMERLPAKRGPRVYVDTVQTGPTRTLVAPYSLRAVPEATVSMPLTWDEVRDDLDPKAYSLDTVPGLVAARTCPMASFAEASPDVGRAVARLAELWAAAR